MKRTTLSEIFSFEQFAREAKILRVKAELKQLLMNFDEVKYYQMREQFVSMQTPLVIFKELVTEVFFEAVIAANQPELWQFLFNIDHYIDFKNDLDFDLLKSLIENMFTQNNLTNLNLFFEYKLNSEILEDRKLMLMMKVAHLADEKKLYLTSQDYLRKVSNTYRLKNSPEKITNCFNRFNLLEETVHLGVFLASHSKNLMFAIKSILLLKDNKRTPDFLNDFLVYWPELKPELDKMLLQIQTLQKQYYFSNSKTLRAFTLHQAYPQQFTLQQAFAYCHAPLHRFALLRKQLDVPGKRHALFTPIFAEIAQPFLNENEKDKLVAIAEEKLNSLKRGVN